MSHSNAALLAKVVLFDGLPSADREELGKRLARRRYEAGEIVFAEGEPGASMYVIVSGAAQVFLGGRAAVPDKRVVLKDAVPGEYFGEMALFDEQPRSASVVATEPSELLEITRQQLADHVVSSPATAFVMLQEMARRLRSTTALLGEHASRDAVKDFEDHMTFGQRIADRVSTFNGSWFFILLLLLMPLAWVIANGVIKDPFDPYPYSFYNLVLALLVTLQGPLIVMSQNRQNAKDRMHAQADFEVNLKNELGIEQLVRDVTALRTDTANRLAMLEADRVKTPRTG